MGVDPDCRRRARAPYDFLAVATDRPEKCGRVLGGQADYRRWDSGDLAQARRSRGLLPRNGQAGLVKVRGRKPLSHFLLGLIHTSAFDHGLSFLSDYVIHAFPLDQPQGSPL
jgi:hypothetical protein